MKRERLDFLADNPFYNDADPRDPMNRYYAYGLRNSIGMDFDPLSGDAIAHPLAT